MFNFFIHENNTPPLGGWSKPPEGKISGDIFRKNTSKYAKIMAELYICDNLN